MADKKKIHASSTGKPDLKTKLREAFIPADVTDVGMYLLTDWILPGVWDFIQGGINSIMPRRGGDPRSANLTNKPQMTARIQQNVAYNKAYDRVNGPRPQVNLGDYASIKIDDRADAEMVRMEMIDIIGEEPDGQGRVSVGWYLNRCDIRPIPAAAWDWGWTNLDWSKIERYGDGWRIVFPKAVPIK